jgi:hypothetical protein
LEGIADLQRGHTHDVRLSGALLLVSLLVALIAPLSSPASTSPQPTLRVLDKAPLVLRGTGFKRADRVRVSVVTASLELVRTPRASRFGTFVVRFHTFVDACHGARAATAVGMHGGEAAIVLVRTLDRYCLAPGGAP